jgi:hypothetical protein
MKICVRRASADVDMTVLECLNLVWSKLKGTKISIASLDTGVRGSTGFDRFMIRPVRPSTVPK